MNAEHEAKEEKLENDDIQTEEVNDPGEEESLETQSDIEDVSFLKHQLEKKESECKEYLEKLQRTMAEFDNFRKRSMKEKSGMYESGVIDTIEKIVPIIDNFERALVTSEEKTESASSFIQGVQMIYKQFKEVLTNLGVEEIKAVGESFDPNLHNAVTHVEDEQYGENEIVEEFQKGYTYKDRVIRYSMVKVAN